MRMGETRACQISFKIYLGYRSWVRTQFLQWPKHLARQAERTEGKKEIEEEEKDTNEIISLMSAKKMKKSVRGNRYSNRVFYFSQTIYLPCIEHNPGKLLVRNLYQ